MVISIVAADSGSLLQQWLEFPRKSVYEPGSPWVSALDSDLRRMFDKRRNPFFKHGDAKLLLAVDEQNKPLGRVLAHIYHRHNARHNERACFFGYFECSNDESVAKTLITAAADFGRANGCAILRGPFNMTAMQECGILLKGFEEAPVVDEVYTASYYPNLMQACGLNQTLPVTTFRIDDVASIQTDKYFVEKHKHLLNEGRIKVRVVQPPKYDTELEILRELLNDSFYENPHFVPITREEFDFQVGPYKSFMDPSIILIAEKEGVPCGFVLAVPNFNPLLKKMNGKLTLKGMFDFMTGKSKLRSAALLIMGVQRQLQGQGVMRLLFIELIRALQSRQYKELTVTWIADVNEKSLGSVKAMGGRPLHRLCLYEMKI